MNDDDKPRLVSGEIMTDARVRATVPADKTDVSDVDCDPVTVSISPTQDALPRAGQPRGPDCLTRANANVIGASPRGGGPLLSSVGRPLVGPASRVSGGHAIVRQQVAARMPA